MHPTADTMTDTTHAPGLGVRNCCNSTPHSTYVRCESRSSSCYHHERAHAPRSSAVITRCTVLFSVSLWDQPCIGRGVRVAWPGEFNEAAVAEQDSSCSSNFSFVTVSNRVLRTRAGMMRPGRIHVHARSTSSSGTAERHGHVAAMEIECAAALPQSFRFQLPLHGWSARPPHRHRTLRCMRPCHMHALQAILHSIPAVLHHRAAVLARLPAYINRRVTRVSFRADDGAVQLAAIGPPIHISLFASLLQFPSS